jgi:hypothetical protein
MKVVISAGYSDITVDMANNAVEIHDDRNEESNDTFGSCKKNKKR